MEFVNVNSETTNVKGKFTGFLTFFEKPFIILQSGKSEIAVNLSSNIKKQLKENKSMLKKGCEIEITFLNEKKYKKLKYKVFEIKINGQVLSSNGVETSIDEVLS